MIIYHQHSNVFHREILEAQGHVVHLYNQQSTRNYIKCLRIFQNIVSIHIASNKSFNTHKYLRIKCKLIYLHTIFALSIYYNGEHNGENILSNYMTLLLANWNFLSLIPVIIFLFFIFLFFYLWKNRLRKKSPKLLNKPTDYMHCICLIQTWNMDNSFAKISLQRFRSFQFKIAILERKNGIHFPVSSISPLFLCKREPYSASCFVFCFHWTFCG